MRKLFNLCFSLLLIIGLIFSQNLFLVDAINFNDSEISINSKEDFYEFAKAINNDSNPMTFNGKTIVLNADINLNNESFTPIGNGNTYFSGTFKGNNHTISNLNVEGAGFVGLFGLVDHAVIQDLKLDKVKITGSGDVGALVGQSVYSKIENCNVSNLDMSVKIKKIDETEETAEDIDENKVADTTVYMGGLVGYNNGDISINYFPDEFNYDAPTALINNCSVEGSIKVTGLITYGAIGGLVGVNHGGSNGSKGINSLAKISNSETKVNITENKDEDLDSTPICVIIGGFIGSNCDYNGVKDKGAIIDSCFSSGKIDLYKNKFGVWSGGFCGYQFNYQGNALIKNCGSSVDVTAGQSLYKEGGFSLSGGFIGSMEGLASASSSVTDEMKQNSDNFVNSLSIENCYCKGNLNLSQSSMVESGGFTGALIYGNSNVNLNNCYCATNLKDIEADENTTKRVGSFCGSTFGLDDKNEYDCKIENCYYDKDLCSFEVVGYLKDGLNYNVQGMQTKDCKSDDGLVKNLNDNIKNLSKTEDWNTWELSSNLDGYPSHYRLNLLSHNSSNNLYIILGVVIGVVLIAAVVWIFIKNKKKGMSLDV